MKIKSLLCGGAGGFTHDDFPRKTQKASEYLLTATLWSPSGNSDQNEVFIQQFIKRYGKNPDYHAVEAYSALLVAADALRKCQSFTASDIRLALDSTKIETPFGEVSFKDYGIYQRHLYCLRYFTGFFGKSAGNQRLHQRHHPLCDAYRLHRRLDLV